MAKEQRPELDQLNLIVPDFEAAVEFYRRLGLEVIVAPASPGAGEIRHGRAVMGNGLSLEFDNIPLAMGYNASWRVPSGGRPAVLNFGLASREAVDSLYRELTTAGYSGRQPPYDAFWGARYAIVADPAGNDVGLMSPVDDARRSWPPGQSPAR